MNKPKRSVDDIIREVKSELPFPDIFDSTAETVKEIATVVQVLKPEGGRLLDIGCGALDKTTVLQKMGYESFGCDDFQDPWHRQQKNLDPILEYANKCGVQVQVQGDDYVIPWDEGSFDVILMVNVIEHLHESPRKFLNSAGSYLREGGLFVVVMPNSVNLRKRLAVAMGRSNYTPARGFFENDGVWRGHVREYTLRETSQILEGRVRCPQKTDLPRDGEATVGQPCATPAIPGRVFAGSRFQGHIVSGRPQAGRLDATAA